MTATVPSPTAPPTAPSAPPTARTLTPPGAAAFGEARRLPLVVRLEIGWVRVRPVHHGDGPALHALVGRMSARTRWLRFHAPVVQLTASQLRSLIQADHLGQQRLLVAVVRLDRS